MDGSSANTSAQRTNRAEPEAIDNQVLAHASQAYRNTHIADVGLMAEIVQHNELALGALYDLYGALVYGVALRITQNRAIAETVVLDVFQAVWQSPSRFCTDTSVPVWLAGMAWRRATEVGHHLRKT